jgi:hypothetical protein
MKQPRLLRGTSKSGARNSRSRDILRIARARDQHPNIQQRDFLLKSSFLLKTEKRNTLTVPPYVLPSVFLSINFVSHRLYPLQRNGLRLPFLLSTLPSRFIVVRVYRRIPVAKSGRYDRGQKWNHGFRLRLHGCVMVVMYVVLGEYDGN